MDPACVMAFISDCIRFFTDKDTGLKINEMIPPQIGDKCVIMKVQFSCDDFRDGQS